MTVRCPQGSLQTVAQMPKRQTLILTFFFRLAFEAFGVTVLCIRFVVKSKDAPGLTPEKIWILRQKVKASSESVMSYTMLSKSHHQIA